MYQNMGSYGDIFSMDINSNDESNASLMNSGDLISAEQCYFEGIMEIFNEPQNGKKLFCGHSINANSFCHVLENINPFNLMYQRSELAESEMLEEEDESQ